MSTIFFCEPPFGEDDACHDTFDSEADRYIHYQSDHPEWNMPAPRPPSITRKRKPTGPVPIDVQRHPEFFTDGAIVPNYEAKDCWICGLRVSANKGHMDMDPESGKFRVMHPGCVERLPRKPGPWTKESAAIFAVFLVLFLLVIIFY